MASTRDIPWLRIAAESAAVVVSILFAFAIDAWWEERLERQDEREELSRLYEEFESNRNRIESNSRYTDSKTASLQLYTMVQEALGDSVNALDVPNSNLLNMLLAPTFEAETPVLEGLVRSGRVSIIEDRRVLNAIAQWDRELRNYTELAQRARQNVDTQLFPGLMVRGNVGHLNMILGQAVASRQSDPNFSGSTSLRIDDTFLALVAQRFENSARAERSLIRAKDIADDVLEAISDVLEN